MERRAGMPQTAIKTLFEAEDAQQNWQLPMSLIPMKRPANDGKEKGFPRPEKPFSKGAISLLAHILK